MATPFQAALEYVLPAAAHSQPGAAAGDAERLAAANFRLFDLNAEARDGLARQQRAGPGRASRGRVGPPQVTVDLASATPFLTVSGPSDGTSLAPLSLESAQGFSSCRANTAVVSGKWQYEVILRSHGILQLGWCLRDTPFTVNNGVGDAPDSYAYDGKRMKRWNVRARTYGRPWAAGDVIGCCIDLSAGENQHHHTQQQQQQPAAAAASAASGSGSGDAQPPPPAAPAAPVAPPPPPPPVGSITFYRNGVSLGTAFANVRMLQHGAAYFPGLSLSQGERCDVNFGQTPFVHPVDGHRPLQAPPPPAAEAYFRAVTCALARLLLLRLRHCAAAACGGGRRNCAGCGAGGAAAGVSPGEAAAVEGRLREFLRAARAADASADAEARAAHAARGADGSAGGSGSGGGAAAAGGGGAGGVALSRDEPPAPEWPGDDGFALLAGLVGDHLLWLLQHSEWWLHAHLLPLALRVHGLEPPHAGGAARALVQLCQLALPPEGFGRLVGALGRVLGHYASMAPFQRPQDPAAPATAGDALGAGERPAAAGGGGGGAQGLQQLLPPGGARQAPGVFQSTGFSSIRQLAHTGAYPFTAALSSIAALPDAAGAWAYGPQWLAQMEAVLSRKLPTLDDLKELMPHVPRFAAASGGGAAAGRVRMQGGEAFRADVRQLTAAMRGIEANQMALAAAAADAAPPLPGVVGGSGAAAAGAAPPLLRLVRHVLRRNRYITSSSPPPGLSDGTVLTSLFYLLLRMLQPYASGARPSRSLRHFPAGRLFVHSAAAEPPPPPPPAPAGGVGPLAAGRAGARGRGGRGAAAAEDGVGEVLSDLIRVGGLLSHLHREARICEDALARHGGRVDVPNWAGGKAAAAGTPPAAARGGRAGGCPPGPGAAAAAASLASASLDDDGGAPVLADEWLPELLSAALVLYTWRVSGSVQSGTAMAGVMEANIGGMQELTELERMLGLAGGQAAQNNSGPMAAARTTVQSEVESSTRYVAITQVVLFSGWKAGALLSMSAYVMALLAAIAGMGTRPDAAALEAPPPADQQPQQQPQLQQQQQEGERPPAAGAASGAADEAEAMGRVLLYVPVAFVSAPLELLLALQAAGSPFAAASCKLTEPQLQAFVGFVVACLCDERIVHPDVRELIMRALSTLLESPGCIAAMERHPAAISSLVPRLMGSFSGEHWQEVALALLRLIGGAGMGELVEPSAQWRTQQRRQQQLEEQQRAAAAAPPARGDWRQRLAPAQRVDSAGAALTVVEAVAAHVRTGNAAADSADSFDGAAGSPAAGGGGAGGESEPGVGQPSSGSDLFRASFGRYASSNLPAAARFLGQLYDSLNSVLTESASLVVELHRAVGLAPATPAQLPPAAAAAAATLAVANAAAGATVLAPPAPAPAADEAGAQQQQQQQPQPQQPPQQQPPGEGAGEAPAAPVGAAPPQPPPERLSQTQLQQRYRRAAALVDVSIALLRLLEATARDAPAVFLCGDTAALAMARLIELLAFVMRHYCSGAEARRLGQLLRQRSLALARQRRAGAAAGGAGAAAAAAARAPFPVAPPGQAGVLNFNVPVPGIGNLTFLVHAQVEDGAAAGGGGGGEGDEEEGSDGDEEMDGGGGGGGAVAGGRGGGQSPVERLARAAVLAPVAGIILNLALAEQDMDEAAAAGGPGGAISGGVRTTAALVGTKQHRARPGGRALPPPCPPGTSRRRSFLSQLAASDIPTESLEQLLHLDWLQLEASRRLLRPERTAGAVAGLLLQDSSDLRSGADALLEERRRSQAASPTPPHPSPPRGGGGGGGGSPRPMDVDREEGTDEARVTGEWEAAAAAGASAGGASDGGGEPGPALRRQLEQLEAVLDAVERRRAAASGGGAGAGPGGGGGASEPAPDDFLDPLTAALMEDPVILPASRMVVDRSTIARHLTYQATDPFSRSPLALDEVIPDTDLAERIRQWQLRQG